MQNADEPLHLLVIRRVLVKFSNYFGVRTMTSPATKAVDATQTAFIQHTFQH